MEVPPMLASSLFAMAGNLSRVTGRAWVNIVRPMESQLNRLLFRAIHAFRSRIQIQDTRPPLIDHQHSHWIRRTDAPFHEAQKTKVSGRDEVRNRVGIRAVNGRWASPASICIDLAYSR